MQSTWSCHSAFHEIQETMRHSRANQACPSWNSSFSIFMGGMHCVAASWACRACVIASFKCLSSALRMASINHSWVWKEGKKGQTSWVCQMIWLQIQLTQELPLHADGLSSLWKIDVWEMCEKDDCMWQIFVGSTRWQWCIHVCEQNHWNEAKIPVPTQCACHTSLDEDLLRESSSR